MAVKRIWVIRLDQPPTRVRKREERGGKRGLPPIFMKILKQLIFHGLDIQGWWKVKLGRDFKSDWEKASGPTALKLGDTFTPRIIEVRKVAYMVVAEGLEVGEFSVYIVEKL